jgi:hypothetical protein
VSSEARERFEVEYSFAFAPNTLDCITLRSFAVIATPLGPATSQVQLLIFDLAITSSGLDILTDTPAILPIHKTKSIHDSLSQLLRLYQIHTEPASDSRSEHRPALEPAPSSSASHQDLSRVPKRPASPLRPSSHRPAKRRIQFDEDDDPFIQRGLNLQPPVRLPTNDNAARFLGLLKAKSAGNTPFNDHEKALRLGQMSPPPLPMVQGGGKNRASSQVHSHSQSQNLMSQIPEIDLSGPLVNLLAPQQDPRAILPNNTPQSAQREYTEPTQSSLPTGSPPRPVQTIHVALASSGTSSSHLLENLSSSIAPSTHRAPSSLWIKYARMEIPANQTCLFNKSDSWWPPKPGTAFPHPNTPLEILEKLEADAARREIDKQRGKEEETAASIPNTQASQESLLPWEPSPTRAEPQRHRLQTFRRSTNTSLPPDSSAMEMDVDEPNDRAPSIHVQSSPPIPPLDSASDSGETDDDDSDDDGHDKIDEHFDRESPQEVIQSNTSQEEVSMVASAVQPGQSSALSISSFPNSSHEVAPATMPKEASSDKAADQRVSPAQTAEFALGKGTKQSQRMTPTETDDDPMDQDQIVQVPESLKVKRCRRPNWGLTGPTEDLETKSNQLKRQFMSTKRRESAQHDDVEMEDAVPAAESEDVPDVKSLSKLKQQDSPPAEAGAADEGILEHPVTVVETPNSRSPEAEGADIPMPDMTRQEAEKQTTSPCVAQTSAQAKVTDQSIGAMPRSMRKPPRQALKVNLEALFMEVVNKRDYRGNSKAFLNLCKKLHGSEIAPSKWDDYVVQYAAVYLPYVNRSVSNGDDTIPYQEFWSERLEGQAKGHMSPVVTSAKLRSIFDGNMSDTGNNQASSVDNFTTSLSTSIPSRLWPN